MYRTIVAKKVRATFDGLSAGRAEALTAQLADSFEYSFRGDHALGGTRTSDAAMKEWFARVYRLFPGIEFEVRDVVVSGPPWRTIVLTHVDVVADGYRNEMFQKLDLRWGRLHEIITLENLEILQRYFAEAAEKGVTEASSPPIS